MLNIFVLNWNAERNLRHLFPGLLKSINGMDYKIFVKDNNSIDGSLEYLESINDDNLITIPYKNNDLNFSEGMNYCYNLACPKDNDYILLLNNDIIFCDNISLKRMINIMDNDPNVGVVGSRLLYTNTNILQHAGIVFQPSYNSPENFKMGMDLDNDSERNRYFQAVTGAILLSKSEYYKNVYYNPKSCNHGMDEDFHWGFDDVDFCLSIKYNLCKDIVYCGQSNIFHEGSASLRKSTSNKVHFRHNVARLNNKWKNRFEYDKHLYLNDSNHNLYRG